MTSDTPVVVDVVAIELTDSRDDDTVDPVIFDNAIGFNDFRGTALQITLTPEELDNHNDISRNLGDNRGHGLHPSLFSPDGQVQQIADPLCKNAQSSNPQGYDFTNPKAI